MSYILEALKKLEQKRKQEEPPTLFTFSRGPRPERKKQSSWPYLLAGVLLLNAVAMIWWVSERQAEKGRTIAEKAAIPRPPVPRAPLAALEERHNPPAEGPAGTKEAPPEAQGSMRQAPAAPWEGATGVPQLRAPKAVETEMTPAQPEIREGKNKKTEGKVLQVSELPSSVRSALPEFNISGHAYSPEPQTRVARINEKILQEGQELAPGLKLEEITPGGVIFGYRGYRFRVELSGNR
jgi:general secretion pathway protein B